MHCHDARASLLLDMNCLLFLLVFVENLSKSTTKVSASFFHFFSATLCERVVGGSAFPIHLYQSSLSELFQGRVYCSRRWSRPSSLPKLFGNFLSVHRFFGQNPEYVERQHAPHVTTFWRRWATFLVHSSILVILYVYMFP